MRATLNNWQTIIIRCTEISQGILIYLLLNGRFKTIIRKRIFLCLFPYKQYICINIIIINQFYLSKRIAKYENSLTFYVHSLHF